MIFYFYTPDLIIYAINIVCFIISTWSKLVFILHTIKLLDKNYIKNGKYLWF